MTEEEANFFTVKEGAEFLGVSPPTLRDAIRDKRIKVERRYGKFVLNKAVLEEYRTKTQPNGVPQVGRPSKSSTKTFDEILAARGSDPLFASSMPFTLEQLVEERNAVSRFIGERIRLRRMELGWNQTQLGKFVGFTREMIAHYEMGKAFVHAADLPLFAKVLAVHLLWFFDSAPSVATTNPLWTHINAMSEEDKAELSDIAAILARRRGVNSQEIFNFGLSSEIAHIDEIKNSE